MNVYGMGSHSQLKSGGFVSFKKQNVEQIKITDEPNQFATLKLGKEKTLELVNVGISVITPLAPNVPQNNKKP
eukprot:569483-Amphidinium_carterae.1